MPPRNTFQLNGEYATNSEKNTFRLPYMFATIQMEQFEINTQQEKLLFIELFTIDANVNFTIFSFIIAIFHGQLAYHSDFFFFLSASRSRAITSSSIRC